MPSLTRDILCSDQIGGLSGTWQALLSSQLDYGAAVTAS